MWNCFEGLLSLKWVFNLPQVCRKTAAVWTISLPRPQGETEGRPAQLSISWIAGSPLPLGGEMSLQPSHVLMCKRKHVIYQVEVYQVLKFSLGPGTRPSLLPVEYSSVLLCFSWRSCPKQGLGNQVFDKSVWFSLRSNIQSWISK